MFALCIPQPHGSTPREHPEILTGIGDGYRKSGFRRTKALISLKSGKITNVTVEDQWEVIYALTRGAKINNLR